MALIFNKHSDLVGAHSFLSPSKYYWINYDNEKLIDSFRNYQAAEKGTRLHAFAAECIELKQKLPKTKQTLNMYVNDAIGFRMIPEQPLVYSANAFGTADSISYRDGFLRIHDLKTGVTQASIHQLEIYAALFFLEYKIKPDKTNIELRIYQNDEIIQENPEIDDILPIMDKIVTFDKLIEEIKYE